MIAIIRTGGKQYRVKAGDTIAVEKLAHEPGADIDLDQVLMIGDGAKATMGNPLVAGAIVAATVIDQTKGDKVIIFKKKRRQNYRRKRGHRQNLTLLHITDIVPAGGTRKPKQEIKVKPKAPAEAKEAKAAAPKKAKAPAKKAAPKAKAAGKAKTKEKK